MKRKSYRIVIIMTLAVCLLLSACGGTDNPGGTTTGGADATGTTGGGSGGSGESLVRMAVADTPTLDPAVSVTEAAFVIYCNIYDTLVWPENDGSTSLWLAESVDISGEGTIYDFKLREGIKFHNGDELTAADVAYSMNRAIAIAQGSGFLWSSKVASAEALDTYTVRFVLNAPNGTFISTLTRLYILNEDQVQANAESGSYGDYGDYGMKYLLSHDAGSGPYQVTEFAQDQYVAVERFPDYWDGFGADNPQKGRFIVVSEAVTMMTMMTRRELEITDPFLPIETYENLRQVEGIELTGVYKGDLMSLSTNVTKAPLDDAHVRKALAYCMDYESIVSNIYPGSRIATTCVPESVMGASTQAFNYAFDLEKAKAELAQSKYADTIGDYTIECAWVASTPDREKLALMLQANASQIGINVDVVKTQWATIVETSTKPDTTFHMVTVITAPDYIEAGAIFETCFLSREVGNYNTMNWAFSDALDSQIVDAITTVDVEQRMEKYITMQNQFMADVPTIPLFEQYFQYAYQAAYLDWGAANRAAAGEPASPALMGYNQYMRDMNIYPDRMN